MTTPKPTTAAEELYRELDVPFPAALPRRVLEKDHTAGEGTAAQVPTTQREDCGVQYDDRTADDLFGAAQAYVPLRKEKPEHRIILWHTLQGRRPGEIAALMRCSRYTVYAVRAQPWFKDAFVRLAKELGTSAVETFLQGHEIPALERLVDLSENAKAEATRLAATNALLDRIRGKPTVKIEAKTESSVDVAVHDAATLLAERARNEQVLKANGVLVGTN